MGLPDERPRASVANLIGRFEQQTQKSIRRASSHSSDLNAKNASVASNSAAETFRITGREGLALSWLKRREPEEKEKKEKEKVDVQSDDATRNDTTPNDQLSPPQPVSIPDPPLEPNPQSLPSPPPEPAEEPKGKNKATDDDIIPPIPTKVVPTKAAPARNTNPPQRSGTMASHSNPTVATLKASKSASALKSRPNVPSSFRAPSIPSIPPLKPQNTGPSPSSTTIPPLRPQLTGGSTTSAPRRVVSTTVTPVRSKTPSSLSRPKTPSSRAPKLPPPSTALHAPTAASLARAKSPASATNDTSSAKKSPASKSATSSPNSKLSASTSAAATNRAATKSPISSTSSNRRLVSVPKGNLAKPQAGVLKKTPGTIIAKVKSSPSKDSPAAATSSAKETDDGEHNVVELPRPKVVVQPATPIVNEYHIPEKNLSSNLPASEPLPEEEVLPERVNDTPEPTPLTEKQDGNSEKSDEAPETEEHKEVMETQPETAVDAYDDDLDKMVSMLEAKPLALSSIASDEHREPKLEGVSDIPDMTDE